MLTTLESELYSAKTINECLKLRQKYLEGKAIQELKNALLTTHDIERKKQIGAELNTMRNSIQKLVDARIQEIQNEQEKDNFDQYDPTFFSPQKKPLHIGNLHPITATIQDIVDIFSKLGFDVFPGDVVLSQWNNFDSVRVPEFHPARDLQDTFFLDKRDDNGKRYVMKTQATSNFAQYAAKHTPPFRVIFPSLTFRNESIDATHDVNFHQFDMWLVEKNVTISHLVSLMNYFFEEFFHEKIQVRLRPSYYPFVQPGFDTEIYIPWLKGGVWLEVAGSGLIHREVFLLNGIDPNEWQGMAWGFGVDRLFMLKNNLNHISQIYNADIRFLEGTRWYSRVIH